MTYNVNRENINKDEAFAAKKMNDLADYIIKNKIDIVGLQEMDSWKTLPNPSGRGVTEDDDVRLKKMLEQKGYPMEMYFRQQWFHVTIFSRFPIIPGSYTEAKMAIVDRWFISGAFNTPIGKVRVLNLHTSAKEERCPQIASIESFIDSNLATEKQYLLAMGDWNASLADSGTCGNIRSRYELTCKRNCGAIDHIVSPVGNSFTVIDGWGESNVLHSDHMPQIAILGSKIQPSTPPLPSPTLIPTIPTAVPTRTPTRTPTVIIPTTVSPPASGISPSPQPSTQVTIIASAPTSSVPLLQRKVSFSFLDWILSHGPIYLNNLQQLDRIIQTKVNTLLP